MTWVLWHEAHAPPTCQVVSMSGTGLSVRGWQDLREDRGQYTLRCPPSSPLSSMSNETDSMKAHAPYSKWPLGTPRSKSLHFRASLLRDKEPPGLRGGSKWHALPGLSAHVVSMYLRHQQRACPGERLREDARAGLIKGWRRVCGSDVEGQGDGG